MIGKDKIVAARVKLLFDMPFFGTLAAGMMLRETDSIPTAATDGKNLLFNPKFTDKLSKMELLFVVCHEVMHLVFLTHLRCGNKDMKIWNQATDHAINLVLKDEGFQLIEGCLCDEKYCDWSAEKIYLYLLDNQEDQASGDAWNIGAVMPGKGEEGQPMTTEELAAAESQVKSKIQGAVMAAKKAGNLPKGIERLVGEICEPKASWREILQRFVSEKAFTDWEFGQCHTRMLHQYGIISPPLGGSTLGHIIIGVDTSGSIDNKALAEFAGEINDVLENYDCRITVVYVDTKINRIDEYTQDDLPLYLHAVGNGGTAPEDLYKYVEDRDEPTACLIHLTDCYLDWSSLEYPGCPVLVAHNTNYTSGVPKWAELIDISE